MRDYCNCIISPFLGERGVLETRPIIAAIDRVDPIPPNIADMWRTLTQAEQLSPEVVSLVNLESDQPRLRGPVRTGNIILNEGELNVFVTNWPVSKGFIRVRLFHDNTLIRSVMLETNRLYVSEFSAPGSYYMELTCFEALYCNANGALFIDQAGGGGIV